MGINLQGNILYIKRSSGLVPTYSVNTPPSNNNLTQNNQSQNAQNSSLANNQNNPLINPLQNPANNLAILTSGLTNNSTTNYMTAEDYVKFRENTSSKVICIRNMVNLKDLEDEDEYDDLICDVREEVKNFGKIIEVRIPRNELPGEIVSGLGKIFVEFATREGAVFAKENLNGKTFNGRFVEVVFHPEEMFRKNQLD